MVNKNIYLDIGEGKEFKVTVHKNFTEMGKFLGISQQSISKRNKLGKVVVFRDNKGTMIGCIEREALMRLMIMHGYKLEE